LRGRRPPDVDRPQLAPVNPVKNGRDADAVPLGDLGDGKGGAVGIAGCGRPGGFAGRGRAVVRGAHAGTAFRRAGRGGGSAFSRFCTSAAIVRGGGAVGPRARSQSESRTSSRQRGSSESRPGCVSIHTTLTVRRKRWGQWTPRDARPAAVCWFFRGAVSEKLSQRTDDGRAPLAGRCGGTSAVRYSFRGPRARGFSNAFARSRKLFFHRSSPC